MLLAELGGKVSEANPPRQRMEDVLTSNVFCLFRYLNNLEVAVHFLNTAANSRGELLPVKPLTLAFTFFWPKFRLPGSPRQREADVILVLEEENRERRSQLPALPPAGPLERLEHVPARLAGLDGANQ
jgi:hypothetical protein